MPFEKVFAQKFSGTVWRLAFDQHHVRPLMGIEWREADTGKGSWLAFDFDEKRFIEQQIGEGGESWLTLVGVFNGILILHRYPDRESPQPRDVLAFDCRKGTLVWQLENAFFQQTNGRTLFVTALNAEGPGITTELDLLTGQPISSGVLPLAFSPPFSLVYANHYSAANPHFPVVARFVEKMTGRTSVEAVDYAETGSYVLVSYYIYAGDALENHLLVVKGLKEILVHEVLAVGSILNPDPFMVYAERLIFVQEKNQLVVYEL